jgi:hypothetical protein
VGQPTAPDYDSPSAKVIRAMCLDVPGIAHATLSHGRILAHTTNGVQSVRLTFEADPPTEWTAPRWQRFTEAQYLSNKRFWSQARQA